MNPLKRKRRKPVHCGFILPESLASLALWTALSRRMGLGQKLWGGC